MTKILALFIGTILLTSCDCYQRVTGIILDKESGKPLMGVTVYNKNKVWSKTTTDSVGYFVLSNVSGGLFGCPPMTVIAEFKSYEPTKFNIPSGGQKVVKMSFDSLNGFLDKWKYFDLAEKINFKIIVHYVASVDCGTRASASVSIGTTEIGDTIRILELCNTKKVFLKGEIVKVTPEKRPDFQVQPSVRYFIEPKGKLKPSNYDYLVVKTTYGKLENN